MTVDGIETTFGYDSGDHRISKTVYDISTEDSVTTNEVWEGSNIICDDVGGESPYISVYIQGLDTEGMVYNDNFYANVYNKHGDVVSLRQVGGSTKENYQYDAYGVNTSTLTYTIPNPYRYSGEYTDVETGKQYLRARYYDPSIGRFTQADT